jgi:hypothetical protein
MIDPIDIDRREMLPPDNRHPACEECGEFAAFYRVFRRAPRRTEFGPPIGPEGPERKLCGRCAKPFADRDDSPNWRDAWSVLLLGIDTPRRSPGPAALGAMFPMGE